MTRARAAGTSGLSFSSDGGVRVSWFAIVSRGDNPPKGD